MKITIRGGLSVVILSGAVALPGGVILSGAAASEVASEVASGWGGFVVRSR